MKKSVLLLEDNAYMNSALKEQLEDNDYIVKEAFQISDAKDIYLEGVDLMIVDLNVPPIGLSSSELDQTEGGIFSSWIWLQNHVFKIHPEFKKKLIVYSAFVSRLKLKYPFETKDILMIEKNQKTQPSSIVKELNKL